ncbi:MAG: hypothetical protein ACK5NN_13850 [Sphingomonadaceae bacterium]
MTGTSFHFRFERSARSDIRVWLLLLVGLVFLYAGATVDPARNCNDAGQCAPWLVPVAWWTGIAFTVIGLGLLWGNPRRGSCIDDATGDLVWWQGRNGKQPGDAGRIHPSRIGRIVFVPTSEDGDEIHLYDRDGQRQPYFDAEVVPWSCHQWARQFVESWPHIELEIRDQEG